MIKIKDKERGESLKEEEEKKKKDDYSKEGGEEEEVELDLHRKRSPFSNIPI